MASNKKFDFEQIKGKKFHSLTFLQDLGVKKTERGYWVRTLLCQCDCGNIVKISGNNRFSTVSCGCLNKKTAVNKKGKVPYRHGGKGTRLFRVWQLMHGRCYNVNNDVYHNYGGRGITVCEEWGVFIVFREWALKNGYTDELTLERINVNGNYEPNNCKWITWYAQNFNKQNTVYLQYKNIRQPIIFWATIIESIEPKISKILSGRHQRLKTKPDRCSFKNELEGYEEILNNYINAYNLDQDKSNQLLLEFIRER